MGSSTFLMKKLLTSNLVNYVLLVQSFSNGIFNHGPYCCPKTLKSILNLKIPLHPLSMIPFILEHNILIYWGCRNACPITSSPSLAPNQPVQISRYFTSLFITMFL